MNDLATGDIQCTDPGSGPDAQEIRDKYVLFLGQPDDPKIAKTAIGVYHWAEDRCLSQVRLEGCVADLGLPEFSYEEAVARGARTLVVGVAPPGGGMPDHWVDHFVDAMRAGLDIASGLHYQLSNHPQLAAAAEEYDRRIIDIRSASTSRNNIGTGRKRAGKRLLTVGTECGVGKMYATLAIEAEMLKRGVNADFRATGQTGILIRGQGVCVDAVISDFISGSVEELTPDNSPDHWDLIEGQGSLFHPSYSGVSLGLLHGSQPDIIVLCHDASRTEMVGLEGYKVPDIQKCIDTNLWAAKLTNPAVKVAGVSVNTSRLSEEDAMAYLKDLEGELNLPVCDPVRTGVESLVDNVLALCAD